MRQNRVFDFSSQTYDKMGSEALKPAGLSIRVLFEPCKKECWLHVRLLLWNTFLKYIAFEREAEE